MFGKYVFNKTLFNKYTLDIRLLDLFGNVLASTTIYSPINNNKLSKIDFIVTSSVSTPTIRKFSEAQTIVDIQTSVLSSIMKDSQTNANLFSNSEVMSRAMKAANINVNSVSIFSSNAITINVMKLVDAAVAISSTISSEADKSSILQQSITLASNISNMISMKTSGLKSGVYVNTDLSAESGKSTIMVGNLAFTSNAYAASAKSVLIDSLIEANLILSDAIIQKFLGAMSNITSITQLSNLVNSIKFINATLTEQAFLSTSSSKQAFAQALSSTTSAITPNLLKTMLINSALASNLVPNGILNKSSFLASSINSMSITTADILKLIVHVANGSVSANSTTDSWISRLLTASSSAFATSGASSQLIKQATLLSVLISSVNVDNLTASKLGQIFSQIDATVALSGLLYPYERDLLKQLIINSIFKTNEDIEGRFILLKPFIGNFKVFEEILGQTGGTEVLFEGVYPVNILDGEFFKSELSGQVNLFEELSGQTDLNDYLQGLFKKK